MATAQDIQWGRYRHFEGPFYRGKHRYNLPSPVNDNDRILAVITATEGGRYDAINMYDGQVISSGLTQFIERAQYSVSAMVGKAIDYNTFFIDELEPALEASNAEFKKNHRGRWRFFFRDDRGEVDREVEQRQLMHGESNGRKGTWSDADKELGKKWAAAVASIWEHPDAQMAQRAFTVPKLRLFAFGESAKVVKRAEELGTDISRAFVAMYLSFAVNNPTRANKHLMIGHKSSEHQAWSYDWLIDVMKELTFGPKISIYPHRYDAIRGPLERLYNLDLPDFAKELENWRVESGHDFFFDVQEVQEALIILGYDLGPWGADGQYGDKTRDAVLTFERLHEVPDPDGMMDPQTAKLLEQELYARGVELLSS